MLFQEAPDPFNGIVLAVIGRIVGQLDSELEVVDKLGDALHELGAAAMVLRAIVQIDDESSDGWIAVTDSGPEISQAIDDEVTGHLGRREVEIEFAVLRQIDPKGCDLRRLAVKVMVESFDHHPIETAAGEETHPDRGFGIQGDAQPGFVGIGFLVDLMHLVKDGVGLRNLFHGTRFFTRLRPKPRALSFWRIVSAVGSSASL